MDRVRALWDLRAEDQPEAGGKALGLARLADLGVDVPEGFVVTASFFEAARQSAPLEPEPEALARSLPEELTREIDAALEALGASPAGYAVRSSAPEEDSRQVSFAGVFESLLAVPRAGVPAAIFRCWASAFSERAAAYRKRMGLAQDEGSLRMAVVVQRMVPAAASGVLFTRDPGGEETVIVQAEDRRGPRRPEAPPATRRLPRDPARRAAERPTATEVAPFPLEDRTVDKLVQLSLRLEAAWGVPLDLEWAFAEGRIWFLQARPITVAAPTGEGGGHKDAGEDTLWTRANLRELLPELPSPLFASLTERIRWVDLYRSLGVRVLPGDRPVRFIEGRPYFNLNLLASWMAQFGMPISRFLTALGHGTSNKDAGTAPPIRPFRALAVSPVALVRMGLAHVSAPRALRDFFAASRREAARLGGIDPAALSDEALVEQLRLSERANTGLISHLLRAFNRVSAFHLMAEPLLPRKQASREGFLSAVLAAGEKSVSARQGADLVRLAAQAREEGPVAGYLAAAGEEHPDFARQLQGSRFLSAFQDYLREYGHRGIHESDPAMPLYREDPAFLLRAIARLAADPAPPDLEALAAAQESSAAQAWESLRNSLPAWERLVPLRLFALRRAVRQLKSAILTRERTRFEGMRVQAEIRRFFTEAGARLARRGFLESQADLFYLRIEEIEPALLGKLDAAAPRETVAIRRAEQERRRRVPMPNLLRESEIGHLAERPPAPVGDASRFHGLAVGPGSIEGRVVILDSPHRISEARRGDILVVPTLDPSWIPLFTLVSGLVVELGGTLSHGSIIAREYGLPTVANLPGITQILKTGERVRLDGSAGTLTRLRSDS